MRGRLLPPSALAAALLLLSCPTRAPAAPRRPADKRFAVVGYLPEYRLSGFDYHAAFRAGLTHLILFSLEVGPNLQPDALGRLPPQDDMARARLAADEAGGKVMISFGGKDRSSNFGAMATDPSARHGFLRSLGKMMEELGLDGVDYNWEYPRSAEEWRALAELMGETRKLLGGKCIVTFAMNLHQRHYDIVKNFNLLDKADLAHVMAYDDRGRHSTYEFFSSGIQYAAKRGLDLSKITMGLPFYARDVHNGEAKAYSELADSLTNEGDDQVGSFYFNGRKTITKKTRAAKSAGLGGVMIWELGQDVQPLDDPRSLMTAVRAGVGSAPELVVDEL